MVNFFVSYISCGVTATVQDVAGLTISFLILPIHLKIFTLYITDHIEHIRNIAGVDNVGVGSDFNGVAR